MKYSFLPRKEGKTGFTAHVRLPTINKQVTEPAISNRMHADADVVIARARHGR
jgi:hypothetical protein